LLVRHILQKFAEGNIKLWDWQWYELPLS